MIRLAAGHLARSPHASGRSLQRYAGPEAIARKVTDGLTPAPFAVGPRRIPSS